MVQAMASCLRLFMQEIRCALALAEDKTGSNSAARIAMMAMTTSSSTNVNARRDLMLYRTAPMEIRFKLYFFDGDCLGLTAHWTSTRVHRDPFFVCLIVA